MKTVGAASIDPMSRARPIPSLIIILDHRETHATT